MRTFGQCVAVAVAVAAVALVVAAAQEGRGRIVRGMERGRGVAGVEKKYTSVKFI